MTLVVAHCSGSPLEVGRAYGDAAGEQIAHALSFYGGIREGGLDAAAARTGPYIDAARGALPHLVEELKGLVEGSGRSFEEIAVLNCVEEIFEFEACTTIASGRFLLHAEQWYAGHDQVTVVVAEPDGAPRFVSPTCAGFLPAVGMNTHGVAQGVDSLYASDDRVGVPRVLVSRHVLSAPSIGAAVRAATIDARAGGYAHFIATAEASTVIETSATRSDVVDGVRVHTNHALSDEIAAISESGSKGSVARFLRASELAEQPLRSLSDCIRVLGDHVGEPQTVCNHASSPTGTATVFGMVGDLVTGAVHVSDGRPCEGEWHSFQVPAFKTSAARRVG